MPSVIKAKEKIVVTQLFKYYCGNEWIGQMLKWLSD